MILRGRVPEATVWRRFRSGVDGFTFSLRGTEVYEARVAANAERAVDLFYTLMEVLSPAVDVVVSDRRTHRSWRGEDVALPDVRDAIARVKVPLATYAGVEIDVYSADDQLALTARLDLYVYARSDRWLYLLEGKGLDRYTAAAETAWRNQPWSHAAAPVLSDALEAAAQRLSLTLT